MIEAMIERRSRRDGGMAAVDLAGRRTRAHGRPVRLLRKRRNGGRAACRRRLRAEQRRGSLLGSPDETLQRSERADRNGSLDLRHGDGAPLFRDAGGAPSAAPSAAQGGNADESTMAVVDPRMNVLGGGGFWIVKPAGRALRAIALASLFRWRFEMRIAFGVRVHPDLAMENCGFAAPGPQFSRIPPQGQPPCGKRPQRAKDMPVRHE